MRVLLAPDRCGELTSVEVADLLEEGWRKVNPDLEIETLPQASGDLGFVAALARLGRVEPAMTTDAWGREVPCTMAVTGGDAGSTIYLEAAQVAGPQRARAGDGAPGPYGTYGVGELVDAALRLKPARIVVGVGDLATLDGGLEALRALAGREPGEGGLEEVLPDARARIGSVTLVAATNDDPGLLGLKGASARTVDLLGRSQEWSQQQEQRMGDYAQAARALAGERTDLLSGAPRRLDRLPGAGAGGGLGFGLALLDADLVNGPAFVARTVGLKDAAQRADLVVTATRTFDWRVLEHSVPREVTDAAGAHGRPVVLIARDVEVGRRETMSFGISGAYAIYTPGPRSGRIEDVDLTAGLARMARRVAGTWTPPPRRDVP